MTASTAYSNGLNSNGAFPELYQQFASDVQNTLKSWNDQRAAVALQRWHIFHNAHVDSSNNPRRIADIKLLAELEMLQAQAPRTAEILQRRFLSDEKVDQVANRMNLDNSRVHSLQAEGIRTITQSLWQQEQNALDQHRHRWLARFEIPITNQLIGVDKIAQPLYQFLKSPSPPWIIAIEGIGGIGKTTLANQLFRQLVDYSDFVDFGWVSAKQAFFNLGGGITPIARPALSAEGLIDALLAQLEAENAQFSALTTSQKQAVLQKRFKEQAHFVVIDNLETVQDVDVLLPLLERWCNPTRFLFTTRNRYEADAGIYHYKVPSLSESDALQLVRHEADMRQTKALSAASDDDLRAIYTVVGGNPLALRLVVGLAHAQGLTLVLEDLRQARGSKIDALYTYIYRKAWESLDEPARYTWLALPLVDSKSASLAELAQAMEDLDTRPVAHEIRFALDRLVQLNLVDTHGELNDRRYSLHQLTRTFLQEQIAKWMG